jgi:protein TonB
MELAVDQVLAERARRTRAPATASLLGAVALHLTAVAALIIVPRLSPPAPPLDFVDVQVVPAAALGAPPTPQQPAKPTPPPPAVAQPAPVLPVTPDKQPKPVKPPPPDTRVDPTTRPPLLPPPRELLAQKLRTLAPPPLAPSPPTPAPVRPGSPTGAATGTAPLGSSIAALDNPDFTYDYYIAQLLSSIDRNWTRPPVGENVHAVVSFRIQRDGSLSDLTIRETSGFNTFDLSALRAVQNAAPFPPLPRAYHHDWLGVNLMVR